MDDATERKSEMCASLLLFGFVLHPMGKARKKLSDDPSNFISSDTSLDAIRRRLEAAFGFSSSALN